MLMFGIDAQKRSHTVVVVDGNGRRLGGRTFGTTTEARVKESEPLLVNAAGVEIVLVRQRGSPYALLDRVFIKAVHCTRAGPRTGA